MGRSPHEQRHAAPCPVCTGAVSYVTECRPDGLVEGATRRRRKCACGHKWTTIEVDKETYLALSRREVALKNLLQERADHDRRLREALA